MLRSRHLILSAMVAAVASVALIGTAQPATPRCFGAAARDPLHPCSNPQLKHAVAPRPTAALLENDAPCQPFVRSNLVSVCYFGVPATQAQESIAIIGDSHATHWRPALEVLANSKGWRGASLARTSCPFSSATPSTLSKWLGRSCVRHNRAIPAWLAKRPWIKTVFIAGNAGARVIPRAGRGGLEETIAGDVRALKSLPKSVKHVIVLRDPAKAGYQTRGCVQRAIRRHEPAGPACAMPASHVLRTDPLVLAARRIGGSRVQVIDLKRFQCSTWLCFPVVGGVLVHQDIDHITRLFATTLGPFLLRAFDGLAAGWPQPIAAAAATAPCFGAAARDPEHPCFNPALRLSVVPRPLTAQLELDSPCSPIRGTGVLNVCTFGEPAGTASDTVALIGDSHATHWRPSLEVLAGDKHWRVINMTRTSCPFSLAPPDKKRKLRKQCEERNRKAPVWLRKHPFVHTVFVAGHAGVRVFGGAKEPLRFRLAKAGYLRTLRSLPPSITHIVVIRDVVNAKSSTINCVQRAIRARRPAGTACALKHSVVARRDPAVAAAQILGTKRVRVIDLTRFQCNVRLCFPVIGGVLVHKDVGHITRLFGTTLGPYMVRAYDRIAANWPG